MVNLSRIKSRLVTILWSALLLTPLPGAGDARKNFNYGANVGIAFEVSGSLCVAIANESLLPGQRFSLILLDPAQSLKQAEVLPGPAGGCADSPRSLKGSHTYPIRLTDASPPSLIAPAMVVLHSVHPLSVVRGRVHGDIDGDGRDEFFRVCASAEGLHMTVWTGKPLTGIRRWRGYEYLGYDLQATCRPSE